MKVWLDQFFKVTERNSRFRTELLGGTTTFFAMAYIIVVNPAILSFAGIPIGPSTVATILTAVVGCLLMGFFVNRPIAVAPYMGENAFIAFGLAAMGVGWEQRLGAVFWSGLALLIITLLGLRQWMSLAISKSMKHSFAAGIGLFLFFVGLYEAGVVTSFIAGLPAGSLGVSGEGIVRTPEVPMKIGQVHRHDVILAIVGFVIMTVLWAKKVRGTLLIGMALTALLGIFWGYAPVPPTWFAVPFTGEYSIAPIALKLDLVSVLQPAFAPIFFTLFLMVFLDTLGTLVGLGMNPGLHDEKSGALPLYRPMVVDAVTTLFASLVGTSTSGAYIESAAGIREGARTGLASLVTAGWFALALFFLPWLLPLQGLKFVYAPALALVGIAMMDHLRQVDFEDWTEAVPAMVTVAMMVFTYNIANGLTAGLFLHPVIKLFCGRAGEVHPGGWVLGVACLAYFVVGVLH